MRQTHRAGEKLSNDFSGGGHDVVDPNTGECWRAKLFVAVLGGSSLTYVEPVFSEDLPTWIGCHVRAFKFFGRCPEVLVPHNLRERGDEGRAVRAGSQPHLRGARASL